MNLKMKNSCIVCYKIDYVKYIKWFFNNVKYIYIYIYWFHITEREHLTKEGLMGSYNIYLKNWVMLSWGWFPQKKKKKKRGEVGDEREIEVDEIKWEWKLWLCC